MSVKRLKKVESLLREEISFMLSKEEIKDPRIGHLLTITEVTVSKDLQYARVYVSCYGDQENRKRSLEALNHAGGFIRTLLGKRLHLRTIPRLSFKQDDSIERGVRINQIIKDLHP